MGEISGYLPVALADNLGRWMAFLFWFLVGCFARPVVAWVAKHPWPLAIAGTLIVGAVASTGTAISSDIRVPLLAFPGIAALVAWSALASRIPLCLRVSAYISRRTLAIYVGHALLLEVLAIGLLVLRRLVPGLELSSTVIALSFVPVLAAALIFVTTWFYDRCVAGFAPWLFQPPWRQGGHRLKLEDRPAS